MQKAKLHHVNLDPSRLIESLSYVTNIVTPILHAMSFQHVRGSAPNWHEDLF